MRCMAHPLQVFAALEAMTRADVLEPLTARTAARVYGTAAKNASSPLPHRPAKQALLRMSVQ